jgi:hypothetical protein
VFAPWLPDMRNAFIRCALMTEVISDVCDKDPKRVVVVGCEANAR